MNMHLHLHLFRCLLDFGPAHAFWLYAFERCNGILVSFHNNNSAQSAPYTRSARNVLQLPCPLRMGPEPCRKTRSATSWYLSSMQRAACPAKCKRRCRMMSSARERSPYSCVLVMWSVQGTFRALRSKLV